MPKSQKVEGAGYRRGDRSADEPFDTLVGADDRGELALADLSAHEIGEGIGHPGYQDDGNEPGKTAGKGIPSRTKDRPPDS